MIVGVSSVTSKGQVTIPAAIRSRLMITPGKKIRFVLTGNKILVEPLNLSSLRGSLRTKIKYDKKEARALIKMRAVKRYLSR